MLAEMGSNWTEVMPGARACQVSVGRDGDSCQTVLPPQLEWLHFEAVFCQRGSITLMRRDGTARTVLGGEILLLADVSALDSIRILGPLTGILVAVDARGARESLKTFCDLLGGLDLDTGRLRQWMREQGGCAAVGQTAWSRAVFENLERLPQKEQARYCVLKSVELLYLLSCPEEQGAAGDQGELDREVVRAVAEVRQYMEDHLAEPMTIQTLSRRSLLSPTAFKTCFRRLYGQPVHAWLRRRRMERAAQLLRTSQFSVLGVAQSVGYNSASQFSAAFRRQYGVSPGQYRKNV